MKKITLWLFLLLITNSVFSQFGCGSAVVITDGYTATGINTPGNGGIEDWNTNPTGTSVNASYWDDDVYLFQYTAGVNSEEITMTIFSINSWNGIGIFSDCTGTTFSGELDAQAATGANASKTVTAILSPNQTVYIAVGQWGTPNGLNFNVTSFSAIPLVNPPSCVSLSNPINGATNVSSPQISWPAATGVPDGYKLSIGTISGGTDILNLFDVGNVLTYNLSALLPNTTYYVTVIPYNSNGDSTGCSESTFVTCGANLAPWAYDVEAASTTTNSTISDCCSSIPTGTTASYRWNVDGAGGTPSSPSTGPTAANSGVKYYYVEASTGVAGAVAELYTPLIDISSLADASLQFFYHMFGNSMGDLHIDIYDGSTWVNDVDVISGQQQMATGEPWRQRIISLSAYTGTIQARFRAIRGIAGNGDISIDDISFDEAPSCLPPTNLTVYNITDTTIDIDWTENGLAFDWEYVLQAPGTGTPTGSGVAIDAQPWEGVISGLTPNTGYEIYIRSACSFSNKSAWFGPVTFSTQCVTYTAPFTEGFNNSGSIPDCWTMSGSENWRFSNTGSGNHIGNNGVINGTTATNGYFAWIDDSTPDTTDATLTTPLIDVSALMVPRLTFYEISNNEGANPNSTLIVEVWDGGAWNTLGTYNTNTIAGWEKKIIDLSALTITGPIQVRFIIQESTSFYDDIAIDDVTVEETPACDAPLTLTALNITNASADLSWSPVGTETSWNIEYGITGFTQGMGTTNSGVTNPYTVSGLTANTTYQYYVQADCTTNGISTWSGPFTFTTLCNPYTIPYFEGFESGYTQDVVIGGCLFQESLSGTEAWSANTSLTSYNRTPRTGSWNAYLEYGNENWLFIPIELVGGTSYTVDLFARQDGATAANSNIAISYGTVGTDAGMTNVITPATGIINGTYQQIIGSFTPASSGTYYVGIKGFMNFSPWYISLDDISINVTPACQDPFGFAVSNLSDVSADLSWSATSGTYEYVLDNNATDPTGSGTPIATETYSAMGLTGLTTYYLHVRTDCGAGTFSAWSTFMFTTSVANDDCSNAQALIPGSSYLNSLIDSSNVGTTAGTEANPINCLGYSGGDVWFSVEVPASGSITIETGDSSTGASGVDTVFTVYSGTCGALTEIDCDDDGAATATYSLLSLTALTAGEILLIRVYEYNNDNTGTFGIAAYDSSLSTSAFNLPSFKAYPNPVKDILSIEYATEITSISVYNLIGQQVLNSKVNATSTKVDMSQLNSGAYIVNLTINAKIQTIKVIKE